MFCDLVGSTSLAARLDAEEHFSARRSTFIVFGKLYYLPNQA
jgi:hypothetical protein